MQFFTLIFLYFFHFEYAWAYIDPGGLGAFFQILLASVITSLIFLREKINSIYSNFKNFFYEFKILSSQIKKNNDIVFFVENKSYYKYLEALIKKLSNEKFRLLCVSSDDLTEELHNISNFIILRSDIIKNIYFSLVKSKILITTTPELGKGYFRVSRNCKHYYYIFHTLVSTHTIYNKNAFKNFDTICCVGNHQVNELFEEEKIYSLPKKKNFFKGGYPFLDKLIQDHSDKTFTRNQVIIAPTWNSKVENYYDKNYSNVIEILLKNNYSVFFRPHPVYIIKKEEEYKLFINKFLNNNNFHIDKGSLKNIINKSEFLISDWSGISFEFSYVTKRPTIFINTEPKINNIDFNKINKSVFEKEKREIIGVICEPNGQDILEKISYLKKNDKKFEENINKDLKESIFNISKSTNYICENIKNIIA